MEERRQYRRSVLFLVRLRMRAPQDDGETTGCYGSVRRVVDGEAHHFDDWTTLVESLIEMMRDKNSAKERLSGGQNNEQG